MSLSREIGDKGEALALKYLSKRGLKLVERNWSCKLGEVDLVMKHLNCLVFVEVRMRAETKYGEGLDTVGYQKQRKLIKTAQYYQQKEDYWGDMRFDVVSIVAREDGEYDIEHIEDAFVVEA